MNKVQEKTMSELSEKSIHECQDERRVNLIKKLRFNEKQNAKTIKSLEQFNKSLLEENKLMTQKFQSVYSGKLDHKLDQYLNDIRIKLMICIGIFFFFLNFYAAHYYKF